MLALKTKKYTATDNNDFTDLKMAEEDCGICMFTDLRDNSKI